ncbi:hypothetical protein D6779_04450 [Candidatus Parcubacteria bacterium]|nr:MAG: hypothetical protein D6779_04450 [Candidatus Parcubacteria bacterium]
MTLTLNVIKTQIACLRSRLPAPPNACSIVREPESLAAVRRRKVLFRHGQPPFVSCHDAVTFRLIGFILVSAQRSFRKALAFSQATRCANAF